MVTCEAGYHSCATFSEMYFGKKVYHKFCKNSNLTCEALCTGYQRNGRKCLETDRVTTSLMTIFRIFVHYSCTIYGYTVP